MHQSKSPLSIRLAVVAGGDSVADYKATIDRVPNAELAVCSDTVTGLLTQSGHSFDAAVVCTDTENAGRLAELGKHLLLTDTSGDFVQPTIAAYKNVDARLMIEAPLRFRSDVAEVKQTLDAGRLGEPGLLRIHCWETIDVDAESRMFGDIDLAVWFFGSLPNSIYAIARNFGGNPDYLQAHLGFCRGGMALIDRHTSMPTGDDYRSLSLIGSTGAAYADDHHNMQLVYRGDHPAAIKTRMDPTVALEQIREFVNSIRESREPISNAESWLATKTVADAVMRSAELGQAAHWNGDQYEFV